MPGPSVSAVARVAAQRHEAVFVVDQDAHFTRIAWAPAAAPVVAAGPTFLAEARSLLRDAPPGGGLVGWIAYEAGRWLERMPSPRGPRPLPDVYLQLVEGFVDLGAPPGAPAAPRVQGSPRFQAQAAAVLAHAATAMSSGRDDVDRAEASRQSSGGPARSSQEDAHQWYPEAVRALLGHIRAGDCYQANLAWRRDTAAPTCPLAAWLRLRQANPAAWSAFLRTPVGTVVSNSPELYLAARGGRLESRPIKGTARRNGDPRTRDQLVRSAKEQAELTMIVDMVRNDLGRVAATGSVRASPRHIRACGDLWHAEQPVHARLAPGLDVFDAVKASFPPASVTGAPKVRAMELIHELEPEARGVYTGAIGWFDTAGDAALSVAIRTVSVGPDRASFHLGAGIVADSVPSAEWQETLDKGRRLAAVLDEVSQP